MIRADMHLKNAIHFEKLARTCTDPTLAAEYHIKALKELGKGLHPLQDISAHKDEYVHRYFIGYIIGDPAFCTPIVIYSHLHTDEPDKPGDPGNQNKRYYETKYNTYNYFRKFFYGVVN